MEGRTPMIDGFQARADELATTRPTGRFRCKATLDDDPGADRTVVRAVARAKEGDREAMRFLYLRYADNVYGYVRSIVQDEYEAEDVTQHVFAKLMLVIGKYEQRSVPFSAWILRLARNVAIDHMRQRRAIPCEEVRELAPRLDDETVHQRSLTLREELAALTQDQREVVMLRHVAGLTPGEIAGRMGKTEPSIHGLHHRGRVALRFALSERECGPTVLARAGA
jgi:RNA polymerase sigma-70 factor (ECF subfamily)